jgi:hypothetical protein
MKYRFAMRILTVLVVSSLFSGCAYTRISIPLDDNFDETELGSKEGKSHTRTVLYLVSWGNGGSKAAAENGDIKIIKHADREIYSILFGLYTRMTTVVYGD